MCPNASCGIEIGLDRTDIKGTDVVDYAELIAMYRRMETIERVLRDTLEQMTWLIEAIKEERDATG